MEKTEKNKEKDRERLNGLVWHDVPSTFKRRTSASGVVFSGKYVKKLR